MGKAIKAEKIARHFATVVSPSLAATPFGTRAVPTLPAIDFSKALATAMRTYGNSAPLFLLTSIAPSSTGDKLFIPVECLLDNPVEISFATAHGNVGTILSANAPPLPAAINCGTTRFTVSTGTAKPTPADAPDGLKISVLTPMRRPALSSRGPPEFPGLMAASV